MGNHQQKIIIKQMKRNKLSFTNLGIPGQLGPPGLTGRDGERGEDGRDGVQGKDGLPGLDGLPGMKGRKGESGRKGVYLPIIFEGDLQNIVTVAEFTSIKISPKIAHKSI